MSVSPEQLLKHTKSKKRSTKNKAARLATKRKRKDTIKSNIKQLLSITKLSVSSTLRIPPFNQLAQYATDFMSRNLSEIKELCKINHIMVSDTKANLVFKLIKCQIHGSAGCCPVCEYPTLELEYLDEMDLLSLPITVVCKHMTGVGRKCRHGRTSIDSSTFIDYLSEWPEGEPVTKKKRVARVMMTVADGFDNVVYLNVPFNKKDVAKNQGARWDRNNKLWYVPMELDIEQFEQWLPKTEMKYVVTMSENNEDGEENEYPSTYDVE